MPEAIDAVVRHSDQDGLNIGRTEWPAASVGWIDLAAFHWIGQSSRDVDLAVDQPLNGFVVLAEQVMDRKGYARPVLDVVATFLSLDR